MRKSTPDGPWVVYRVNAGEQGAVGVCEQSEWEAMEAAEPGHRRLIRGGIATEAEAERVAREAPGRAAPGKVTLKRR